MSSGLGMMAAILLLTPDVVQCAPHHKDATKSAVDETAAKRELLAATSEWLRATVAGDFTTQAHFYPETMDAFYLWRDVPKSKVIAEKRRVFAQADTIDINVEPPQMLVDANGRSARMYFRKTYVIQGPINRRGEVLQELRWIKEDDGWKIISERDLSVVHHASSQR